MKFNKKHKCLVESRGYTCVTSYATNEVTIDGKNRNRKLTYMRVKCPYCDCEYDVTWNSFRDGTVCTNCCNKYENSFAYHIQVELGESLNKYWDWDKNTVNPYLIYKNQKIRVWIKCQDTNYHGSYDINCNNFFNKRRCSYCFGKKTHPKDSLAQWFIDNIGLDMFNKIWSNKNTIDPWCIKRNANKKVWLKCLEKDYHDDYLTNCSSLMIKTNLNRCPLCTNHRGIVHKLDSFGSLYPKKAKYWSKNNKLTEFEVSPKSNNKYLFICENCGKEFKRTLSNLNSRNCGVVCNECNSSQGETKIKEILDKFNMNYESQKSYDNLFGTKGRKLLYDFYLPDYNLLIEYQGEFHDGNNSCQTNLGLSRQMQNDQRKRSYANLYNIKLLEIWYWDFDNIEEILSRELILQ